MRIRRLAWMAAAVVGALGVGVLQPERPRVRLYPIDEAPQVPAFKAYRDVLQAAVAVRDADRVLAMMHPELGQGGLEMALRTTREQLSGRDHKSWTALEELLRLGGTFTKRPPRVAGTGQRQHVTREFCAPYTWSAYPAPVPQAVAGMVDPWVILGSRVAVRAKPPHDMRVLMRLDYDLVQLYSTADVHAGAPQEWIGIVTPRHQLGYVAASLIRSPDDYRACFGEFEGTWLMTHYGST